MRFATLLVLVGSITAGAQEQAALGTLRGVDDILVLSAHEGLSSSSLGQHVQSRLRSEGLRSEPGSVDSGRLYVEVVRFGPPSPRGLTKGGYEVRVSLEEAVTIHRSPGLTAHAVTWRESRRVGEFAVMTPEALLGAVDALLESFVKSVLGAPTPR